VSVFPDESTTVDIEMTVRKTFLHAYTDMLSLEYVQLAGNVRQTVSIYRKKHIKTRIYLDE